jgi:hypothetical protein
VSAESVIKIRGRMTYDLSRLSSPDEFERLIQALTTRHFGPGVIVFGDGPDGGREAVVEGTLRYAPHGELWDGRSVIQAKFRQRPLGTEKDGPWALKLLAKELDKFAERAGGRTRPDNYVFATNVVLSSGIGGAKDRAIELLEAAKSAWGLRDYDIWENDKLCTWIDLDAEVRTRFGWTMEGDVLERLRRTLDLSHPELERTLVNYLEKTLIAERFVRLEQAGHSAQQPVALTQVFVDLPIGREHDRTGELFLRRLLERAAPLERAAQDGGRGESPRIVLVGGPGQGKTTLGQFACQIFRAGLLAGLPAESLSPEGQDAVDAVRAACATAELEFERSPRFPVRVALTDLASALIEQEQPLIAYLAGAISKRVGSRVSVDVFRQWLREAPWFLVLDGLDEVPANAGRDLVMRCIGDFWVDVAQLEADVLVLATTRPQGYNDDFSPERHEHVALAELPTWRALDYGSRLADARHGSGSERAEAVKERLARAADDRATEHLMRSPLQVAIMTALVDSSGQPPPERWSLFDAYYDVIYKREQERDSDAAAILREFRPDVDAIHQRVGLTLQVLTTDGGHSDPRLTGAQLGRIIRARLESEGHNGEALTRMAEQIRAAAELRLVFLVGAESNRIGFEIRSLQEFMAAGALVDGSDEQVIDRLKAIAPLPAWRNVFLFAAGKCFSQRQHLRGSLQALCGELDHDPEEPLLTTTRAGSRLALDLLEDRTTQRQPKYHRMLASTALGVLELPSGDSILTLADCHDDDVDDLYRKALAAALRDSDAIRRTGARKCLVALNSAGVDWAGQMLHEHLPSDSADAIELLRMLPPTMVHTLDKRDVAACFAQLGPEEFALLIADAPDNAPPEDLWTETDYYYEDLLAEGELGIGSLPHLAFTIERVNKVPFACWPVEHGGPAVDVHSPTTAVYRAAMRFSSAPSHTLLADLLDELARTSTPGVWQACATQISWPMGALLEQADSAQRLVRAAADVRAGAHGDLDAWVAAEEQWINGPLSLLDGLRAEPVPFPICMTGCVRDSESGIGLPWLDVLHALPRGHAKRQLAETMLEYMGQTGSPAEQRCQLSDVIDVVLAAAPGPAQLNIGILDADTSDLSQVRTLLESLPEQTRLVYTTFLEGYATRIGAAVVAELEQYAVDRPSARSCEALAVTLATLQERPLPRTLALSPQPTDLIAYAAAAFVSFITRDGSAPDRELGTRFAVAHDTGLERLLKSFITATTPSLADFLIGYYEAAPRTWRGLGGVYNRLDREVSRRRASLADATKWRALGLFEPHPLALLEAGRGS